MFFKAVINQYWFKKKAIFWSYRDISYSILSEQVATEECLSNSIVLVKLLNFRQIHDSRLDPDLCICLQQIAALGAQENIFSASH